MASTEQNGYWQQDDKSVMTKIFLTIGAFGVIIGIVAVIIGYLL